MNKEEKLNLIHKHYEQLEIMQIISAHKSQYTLVHELNISVGKINHIVKALIE